MKLYNIHTITTIRFILKDKLSKPGTITTTIALREIDKNSDFKMSKSSLRNIFTFIMNDMVKVGRAEKLHRGTWNILYDNNPDEVKLNASKTGPAYMTPMIKEQLPVTFDPKLNAWLNPPPCTKHIEVYDQLKNIKDKTRFTETAIRLCDQAGIPIKRLINYINEQRQQRHNETGRCEVVQPVELKTIWCQEAVRDTKRDSIFP